jgi:murein L,D-transpeptidase YafK
VRRLFTLILVVTAACAAAGLHADEPPLRAGQVDRLVVRKGDHVLEAWQGERLVRSYRVAIGSGGEGHKRMEGDGRTPEGRYTIDRRHRSKAFHRFLHVSYPNAGDRRAFREALRSGELPRGAGIGGDIGIHGEPRGWTGLPHKWVDWTAGCVALDDAEIEELFVAVRPGALVEIVP